MTNVKTVRTSVLSDAEVAFMMQRAELLPEYRSLRALALVSLFRIFGKRCSEIASLEIQDLVVTGNFLLVTFTIRKKHKKGLFQYLKLVQKSSPESADKSLATLQEEWQTWRETEPGYTVRTLKRTKKIDAQNKYAKHITRYLQYMKSTYPDAQYLFPSQKSVFGQSFAVSTDKYISGRQILNIIKGLYEKAWPQLFRETKGAEIARSQDMSLSSVYDIMLTLDHEDEKTAMNYVRRYGIQEVKDHEARESPLTASKES